MECHRLWLPSSVSSIFPVQSKHGKTWSFREKKNTLSLILFLHPRIKKIIKSTFLKNDRSCFIWKWHQRPCPSRMRKLHQITLESGMSFRWAPNLVRISEFFNDIFKKQSKKTQWDDKIWNLKGLDFIHSNTIASGVYDASQCAMQILYWDEINSINVLNPKPRKTQRILLIIRYLFCTISLKHSP